MNELTLCKNISALRKGAGMTQDALAQKLGLSYQAISKWENGLSCPDVQLLPQIADIFNISIDALFGRETAMPQPESEPAALVPAENIQQALPWEDDNGLYIALYQGHELLNEDALPLDLLNEVPFIYEGPALNILSVLPVHIEGDVMGNVFSGGDVDCENVGGDVSAAGDVDCGSVEGNVNAGGDVDCGGVDGNIFAEGDVDCSSVGGNIIAQGDVDCSSVGGSVIAGGDVDAGTVGRGRKGDCSDINRMMAQMGDQLRRAQQQAEEQIRQAQQMVDKARKALPQAPGTYHYKNDRVHADIVMDGMDSDQIKEKVDGIVDSVEKFVDGFFDKLNFGKKKDDK